MSVGRFPTTRMRRNRHDAWTRRLVAEHRLSVDDLIWPVFLIEGAPRPPRSPRCPAWCGVTLDRLAGHVEPRRGSASRRSRCSRRRPPSKKDPEGTEATNPDNLMCQSARLLKREFPEVGLVGDVALDPYTDHGHDGVIRDGYVANDETLTVLARQALVQARGRGST